MHQRAIRLPLQLDIRIQLPRLVARGAAMGDHAAFGGAEYFNHGRVITLLRFDREFTRHRRRGRDDCRQLGQNLTRTQQRAQMHRRRDQQTWRWHFPQRIHDIDRKQWPRAVYRHVAEQGQQHRHFQAVHVLRWHGRDDVRVSAVLAATNFLQQRGVQRRAGAQAAPGFRIGFWRTGAARGVADRNDLRAPQLRNVQHVITGASSELGQYKTPLRRGACHSAIADDIAISMRLHHLGHGLRRARWRQQIYLTTQGHGAEGDDEMITVFAQVGRVNEVGQ